jgi:hypothetical protein
LFQLPLVEFSQQNDLSQKTEDSSLEFAVPVAYYAVFGSVNIRAQVRPAASASGPTSMTLD